MFHVGSLSTGEEKKRKLPASIINIIIQKEKKFMPCSWKNNPKKTSQVSVRLQFSSSSPSSPS
jgi:hypothetical protein